MRRSSILTLDAVKVMTEEASADRELMQRSIAHEEATLRSLADMYAEEMRIISIEVADRQTRIKAMFDQLRANAEGKIALCREQLERLDNGLEARLSAQQQKALETDITKRGAPSRAEGEEGNGNENVVGLHAASF